MNNIRHRNHSNPGNTVVSDNKEGEVYCDFERRGSVLQGDSTSGLPDPQELDSEWAQDVYDSIELDSPFSGVSFNSMNNRPADSCAFAQANNHASSNHTSEWVAPELLVHDTCDPFEGRKHNYFNALKSNGTTVICPPMVEQTSNGVCNDAREGYHSVIQPVTTHVVGCKNSNQMDLDEKYTTNRHFNDSNSTLCSNVVSNHNLLATVPPGKHDTSIYNNTNSQLPSNEKAITPKLTQNGDLQQLVKDLYSQLKIFKQENISMKQEIRSLQVSKTNNGCSSEAILKEKTKPRPSKTIKVPGF